MQGTIKQALEVFAVDSEQKDDDIMANESQPKFVQNFKEITKSYSIVKCSKSNEIEPLSEFDSIAINIAVAEKN